MHHKVAEKVAQTRLTNVYVLLAHTLEEAEDAYEKAPIGSSLEAVAQDVVENLRAVMETIAKKIGADYEASIRGDGS